MSIENRDPGEEYNLLCKVMGFLVQFTFLCTFFWMNVLSYDIFRKFTRFRKATGTFVFAIV